MRTFPQRWSLILAAMLLWLVAPLLVALAASRGVEIPAGTPGPGRATVLTIDGPIGPATSRYIVRGIAQAAKAGSPLVIIELDTPGGLDTSMRDIIRAILASPVPVVGYVYPPGARAASAGTYILYACHVAAMAPATNLGAATPVSITGDDPAPEPAGSSASSSQAASSASSVARSPGGAHSTPPAAAASSSSAPSGSPPLAMERKVVNDAVAYIRGLAELRGHNAEWAEAAVRGAASLPASAALAQNVVDLIAPDVPALLAQLDGREVHLGQRVVKLATRDLGLITTPPDWATQLLAVITHPTVAYGLLLIGLYGLLFEGYNPGAVFPGVVGAISLLIALFAFQILSVNYAGLALIVLGVGLIVTEFFMPAYGSLGVGGLIAFVLGSVMLFDSDVPGLSVGWPLIAGLATGGGLVLMGMVYLATRSVLRPVVTGAQAMVGEHAVVTEPFSGAGAEREGRVRYRAEIWNAVSSQALGSGEKARIIKVDGLTLHVEPLTGAPQLPDGVAAQTR
jgi:membrane-bound serine protease (ClpP class)